MTISGTKTDRTEFDEYLNVRMRAFKTFDFERISQCMQLYGNQPPQDTPEFWIMVARTVLNNNPTRHQRAEARRILSELNERY